VKSPVEHAEALKQALLNFVLDSEDDVATALETYSAEELARLSKSQHGSSQSFVMDSFLVEGQVGDATPIARFLADQRELTESDRHLLQSWHRSFIGLFTVTEVLADGFQVMNWLTEKQYSIKVNPSQPQPFARLKPGEIFLTRIVPLEAPDWMFFSPLTLLGKLGKPKLAVAIGNFKQYHKKNMYGDAPEVLAEAWRSVERQYQEFVEFFGSGEVSLSGYHLGKKINEFQEALTQKRLTAAGIDGTQSLEQLAQEAGIPEAEVAAVKRAGVDTQSVQKMMSAPMQLPDHLRKAEEVTVLTHPRWGQIFLPNYSRFKQLLALNDEASLSEAIKLARQYWNDPTVPSEVWQRLANEYAAGLEPVLASVSADSAFRIADLEALLKAAGKPLEPELPEIASVPIHLHELFQGAIVDVSKNSDPKSKPAAKKGFQSR
jgi:hypothetical protein